MSHYDILWYNRPTAGLWDGGPIYLEFSAGDNPIFNRLKLVPLHLWCHQGHVDIFAHITHFEIYTKDCPEKPASQRRVTDAYVSMA